jgi:hypothetical protein
MSTHNLNSINDQLLEATNKKIVLIFFAFIISITTFATFSIFFIESSGMKNESSEQFDVFLFVVPTLGIMGLVASQFLYKNILNQARAVEGVLKFQQYQVAMLVKYALLEGPSLIALLAYLLSGNHVHLITAAVLVSILIIQKPSIEKCRSELLY